MQVNWSNTPSASRCTFCGQSGQTGTGEGRQILAVSSDPTVVQFCDRCLAWLFADVARLQIVSLGRWAGDFPSGEKPFTVRTISSKPISGLLNEAAGGCDFCDRDESSVNLIQSPNQAVRLCDHCLSTILGAAIQITIGNVKVELRRLI